MQAKRAARSLLRHLLDSYGYEMVPASQLYEWQRYPNTLRQCPQPSALSSESEGYLRMDHPRLEELERRYATFDTRVTDPLIWNGAYVEPQDLLSFRGDNPYVWQSRGQNMNPVGYALAAYYLQSMDTLRLLTKLSEDDLFGVVTFTINDTTVSRDLLDSIAEIQFLERHLKLSTWAEGPKLVDIGAGYGRLAHRMVSGISNIQSYWCTDAVAISTFICEFYLQFRAVGEKATVVPLDEAEDALMSNPPDIAVNIHSFSECKISAIEWWLALLRNSGVGYLMVVPNALDVGGRQLLTNDRSDFKMVIERHGYELIAREPKYLDQVVQDYAMNPTYHYLFRLHSSRRTRPHFDV
jgi:hypothetical protein